jgi:hypothetical protein
VSSEGNTSVSCQAKDPFPNGSSRGAILGMAGEGGVGAFTGRATCRHDGAGGAAPTRWARRGGGPVRPSGWPPCARGVPRLDERQGCPLVLARSVGRPWTGARRPALRAPAVRAVPRMDCALHVRSRHSNLGGELRNPDGPDDLGESPLHGEALVDGGQEEGAGKRAVAQPLREIDVPVVTVSCRVCPPASHSNTGARRMS